MRERRDIQEVSNAKDDAVDLRPDFEQDIEDVVHILKSVGDLLLGTSINFRGRTVPCPHEMKSRRSRAGTSD
jgi:hypothetical protein